MGPVGPVAAEAVTMGSVRPVGLERAVGTMATSKSMTAEAMATKSVSMAAAALGVGHRAGQGSRRRLRCRAGIGDGNDGSQQADNLKETRELAIISLSYYLQRILHVKY